MEHLCIGAGEVAEGLGAIAGRGEVSGPVTWTRRLRPRSSSHWVAVRAPWLSSDIRVMASSGPWVKA